MSFGNDRVLKAKLFEGVSSKRNYADVLTGFENGITKLIGYSDGTTRPTGVFGGSASNLTKAANSVNPIENSFSLKLGRTAAAQGQGYYFDFTPMRKHKLAGASLNIKFALELLTGTFLGSVNPSVDSDFIIGVWDMANNKNIEPGNRLLEPMVTNFIYKYQSSFQIPINATTLRVYIHSATTNSAAFEINIDDLEISENIINTGALEFGWTPVTGVKLYGASNGLEFTNQTTTAFEKRIGDSVMYRIRTSFSGAPATGTGKFEWSIPRVVDSSKINVSTSATIGHIAFIDSGTAFKENAYPYLNSTSRISVTSDGGVDRWDSTSPISWTINDAIEIVTDLLPIVGLGSTAIMLNNYDTIEIFSKVYRSSNQVISSPSSQIQFENIGQNNTGAYSNSTYDFLVQKTSQVEILGNLRIDTGGVAPSQVIIYVSVNGANSSLIAAPTDFLPNKAYVFPIVYKDIHQAGQLLSIRVESVGQNVTLIGSSQSYVSFNISRSSFNYLNESRIAAKYITGSAQSIPTSVVTILNFETKVWDDLECVEVGGSWKFRSKSYGIYSVKVNFLYDNAAWNVDDKRSIDIFKNNIQYQVLKYIETSAATTTYAEVSGDGDVELNAGEFFDIRTFQNSGSSKSLINNSAFNCISIVKVK